MFALCPCCRVSFTGLWVTPHLHWFIITSCGQRTDAQSEWNPHQHCSPVISWLPLWWNFVSKPDHLQFSISTAFKPPKHWGGFKLILSSLHLNNQRRWMSRIMAKMVLFLDFRFFVLFFSTEILYANDFKVQNMQSLKTFCVYKCL